MAIRVTCPNESCGKTYNVKDELAGKKVRCASCGAVMAVPQAAQGLDETTAPPPQEEAIPSHHPARQVCTNCGAVLGVRDTFCTKCGADIRTGIAKKHEVEEKKFPLGLVLAGAGGLIVVAIIVFVVIMLVKNRSPEPEPVEAPAPVVEAPAAPPEPVKPP